MLTHIHEKKTDLLYYFVATVIIKCSYFAAAFNEYMHAYMAQHDPRQQTANMSPWELRRACEIEIYLSEISNL